MYPLSMFVLVRCDVCICFSKCSTLVRSLSMSLGRVKHQRSPVQMLLHKNHVIHGLSGTQAGRDVSMSFCTKTFTYPASKGCLITISAALNKPIRVIPEDVVVPIADCVGERSLVFENWIVFFHGTKYDQRRTIERLANYPI
jgi:hypothetical protein